MRPFVRMNDGSNPDDRAGGMIYACTSVGATRSPFVSLLLKLSRCERCVYVESVVVEEIVCRNFNGACGNFSVVSVYGRYS